MIMFQHGLDTSTTEQRTNKPMSSLLREPQIYYVCPNTRSACFRYVLLTSRISCKICSQCQPSSQFYNKNNPMFLKVLHSKQHFHSKDSTHLPGAFRHLGFITNTQRLSIDSSTIPENPVPQNPEQNLTQS